jgi:hypothetical protein
MSQFRDIRDQIGAIRGHVVVHLHKPDTPSVKWYDDHNVVVDLGRERVAKWLSGETDIDRPDAMIIGNGGSEPINNISPSAPDRTDTGMGVGSSGGRIGGTDLLSGQDTSNANATQVVSILRALNSVRYDATFNADNLAVTDFPQQSATDHGSGAGLNLGLDAQFVSELGLITTTVGDELFARVTFPPISFQPGSSTAITVQWTITIL